MYRGAEPHIYPIDVAAREHEVTTTGWQASEVMVALRDIE